MAKAFAAERRPVSPDSQGCLKTTTCLRTPTKSKIFFPIKQIVTNLLKNPETMKKSSSLRVI